MSQPVPRPVRKSAFWTAALLSQFPAGTVVPRQELRDMAAAGRREPNTIERNLRQTQRAVTRGRGGTRNLGNKSSKALAESLRELEGLGLVTRNGADDSVTVVNPRGLSKIVELGELEERLGAERHTAGAGAGPVGPSLVPHPGAGQGPE